MAKKEKQQKDKPLEKMTIKELKEIALEIPDVIGAHGMNKAELFTVIKEHRGIVDEGKSKTVDTRAVKKQIAELKAEKKKIQAEGDKKKIDRIRRKISRLKKKTRKAA